MRPGTSAASCPTPAWKPTRQGRRLRHEGRENIHKGSVLATKYHKPWNTTRQRHRVSPVGSGLQAAALAHLPVSGPDLRPLGLTAFGSGLQDMPTLSSCWHLLTCPVETPTRVRGACSRTTAAALASLACCGGTAALSLSAGPPAAPSAGTAGRAAGIFGSSKIRIPPPTSAPLWAAP